MVAKLLEELAAIEQVEAIALGGSRAGEVYDAKSDYDVYLYCTGPIEERVRTEILERYCQTMEIGNHFWEYEDNGTLNNGIDIDILYHNLEDSVNDVASVVEQYQARNGYTTCMWHNLRTCKIVYDRDGRLAAAKRRFDVAYPKQLKELSINHRTAAFMESYFVLQTCLRIMMQVPVDKEYYDSVEVGDKIDDSFRMGSLIMKGSFGSWKVTVDDKEIHEVVEE